MALTYGFFNSVDGDRKYNADQISEYFKGLVSNGVYESVGNALQVKISSGMTVSVETGRALIDCKWLNNDAIYNVDISPAHVTLNRYTAIILQLNKTTRTIDIITRDGTEAASPTKPALVENTTISELCLAYVYVAAGVSSISQSNITDMRGSSLCPWVTGLIKQVDTSELFLQYQTAYEEYLAAMQSGFDTWLSGHVAEMDTWKAQQKADMEGWKDVQETAFDSWMTTLTEQLQINTYVKEYKNVVITASEVTELNIGIDEYDSANDILYANINGVMFVENEDYTISGTGSTAKIVLTNSIRENNTVEFRVLKSVIGSNSSATGDRIVSIESTNSFNVTDDGAGTVTITT